MKTGILVCYLAALIAVALALPWLRAAVGEPLCEVLALGSITVLTLGMGALLVHFTGVSAADIYMVGICLLGVFYSHLKAQLTPATLVVVAFAYALALRYLAIWISRHFQVQSAKGSPQ